MIRVSVGFDQREAVAYHAFVQSVLERASAPVTFNPLALNCLSGYRETHADGSNDFIYSRFLVPFLYDFKGWSIFADGDMICLRDIAELWALRDDTKAALVVKHNYKTKAKIKYLGNRNEDYPKKNWSSLILWNCEHPKNFCLTPDFISCQTGSFLHRFSWLDDDDVGLLPLEWNWLATEYPDNHSVNLVHYTLGTPCFKDFENCEMSEYWKQTHARLNQGVGA